MPIRYRLSNIHGSGYGIFFHNTCYLCPIAGYKESQLSSIQEAWSGMEIQEDENSSAHLKSTSFIHVRIA